MILKISQAILLVFLSGLSVFIGVAEISPLDLLDLSSEQAQIMLSSRLPRLFSILVAGSSLAVSGLIMQRITRNRFVSPTTAGTMEWCRLGVMASILLLPQAPSLLRVVCAFVVSFCGTMLFLAIVNRIRNAGIILVPLVGIMLGGVVNALSTFFAYRYDIIQNMASWLQGNFSLVIAGNYELIYIGIPLMAAAYIFADRFTIAGMGKNTASTLGLRYSAVLYTGLAIVAVVSSVSVVAVGNIPFVGLIVPNVVSLYRGDSVKRVLWDTAWLGALLVLVCDIAGRIAIYPFELPIGIVLSIIGSAVFLILITNSKKSYA